MDKALRIVSLEEWQVPLNEDVAKILGKSVDLDEVLDRMKRSPIETTCRMVNRSSINLDNAIVTIRGTLQPWMQARSILNSEVIIQTHAVLRDVVTIQIDYDARNMRLTGDKTPCRRLGGLHGPLDESFLCSWPTDYKIIIVDRFTGEAILRGSDVFVRGVQAASSSVFCNDRVAVYASMTPILRGLQVTQYTGTCIFCGVGVAKTTRAGMFSKQTGLAVEMIESVGPLLPPRTSIESPSHMLITLQNLPSCMVATALASSVGRHQLILDMCACPGAKTTHLASLIPDDCHIIACDKSRKKILAAKNLFRLHGLDMKITPLAIDSRKAILQQDSDDTNLSLSQILKPERLEKDSKNQLISIKGFPAGSIDHILLDPPCSALGLRPKLDVSHVTKDYLNSVVLYQKQFIRTAIGLLKCNGFMTYSTCTIHMEENEDMVRWLLDTFPCMILVPIPIELGQSGRHLSSLTAAERDMVRYFDPTDRKLDTMGFFVAKFQKIKES